MLTNGLTKKMCTKFIISILDKSQKLKNSNIFVWSKIEDLKLKSHPSPDSIGDIIWQN